MPCQTPTNPGSALGAKALTRDDLAFVTQDGTTRAEPGEFDIQVELHGPASGVRALFSLLSR